MKNITVSVDEETHRLARIRAAELDTSVSALVRNYLRALAWQRSIQGESMTMEQAREREFERRRQLMGEVIDDIRATRSRFKAADNLTREELYDRARARARGHRDNCWRAQSSVVVAAALTGLRIPTSHRLKALRGDREGQYSIRVNDQWRVCFRWTERSAMEIEVTDYH